MTVKSGEQNRPSDNDKTGAGDQDGDDNGLGGATGGADGGDDDEDTDEDKAAARRIGWVPETEWKGKKAPKHGFMSAKEYIARGEQVLPVMIERNRRLNDAVADRDKTNRELSGKLDEAIKKVGELGEVVGTLHKANVDVAKRAYDKARKDILDAQIKAATDADPAKVATLQTQLDELDKTKPVDPPARTAATEDDEDDDGKGGNKGRQQRQNDGTPQPSQATRDWIAKNKWFNESPKLNGAAIEQHTENMKSGMTEDESFEVLADQIKEEFPDRFENPERRRAPAVSRPRGGGGTPPKKGKTFDDLPTDAKAAFEAIRSRDKDYTKEQYLKDYAWD
jgi:hypothetical protein